MEKYKKIGFSVIVLLVIVVLAVVVFRPKNNKKVEGTISETTTFSTKEETKKTPPVEKSFFTKEQKEAIESKENEEEIIEVVHSFMDVFDYSSTKDYKEMMPQVHDIMTKEAQETLIPFYEGDKNMEEITNNLVDENLYVSYESKSNHAKTISFVPKDQSYNSDPTQYRTNYIIEHQLEKENGKWKISSRLSQSVPSSFYSQLFE